MKTSRHTNPTPVNPQAGQWPSTPPASTGTRERPTPTPKLSKTVYEQYVEFVATGYEFLRQVQSGISTERELDEEEKFYFSEIREALDLAEILEAQAQAVMSSASGRADRPPEHVHLRLGREGFFLCVCGTTPRECPFYRCNEHGERVDRDTNFSRCGWCGRFFDKTTLQVLGQRPRDD